MVKSCPREWSSWLQVRLQSPAGSVGLQLMLCLLDLPPWAPLRTLPGQKLSSLFACVLKALLVLDPNFVIGVNLP